MVVPTPMAWLGIRFRGLAPATTIRLMGLTNRLLPAAPGRGGAGPVEGQVARAALSSRLLDVLTTFGHRTERRNNEV